MGDIHLTWEKKWKIHLDTFVALDCVLLYCQVGVFQTHSPFSFSITLNLAINQPKSRLLECFVIVIEINEHFMTILTRNKKGPEWAELILPKLEYSVQTRKISSPWWSTRNNRWGRFITLSTDSIIIDLITFLVFCHRRSAIHKNYKYQLWKTH